MFERVLRLGRPPQATPTEAGGDPADCQDDSVEIRLSQECEGDESVVVWDAALVLAHFLQHRVSLGHLDLRGKRVVELGAGTGAVGIAASVLGADVVLTDLESCLPLLRKNTALNQSLLTDGAKLESRSLSWGVDSEVAALTKERGRFDLVLLSDCIYYESSLKPLVHTLAGLGCPVLVSYEERHSEEKQRVQKAFFELVGKEGFSVHEFATSECHPDFASPDIHVLRLDPAK